MGKVLVLCLYVSPFGINVECILQSCGVCRCRCESPNAVQTSSREALYTDG